MGVGIPSNQAAQYWSAPQRRAGAKRCPRGKSRSPHLVEECVCIYPGGKSAPDCFRYALPGSQGTHTCIARLPARCSCSGSPNQPGLPSVPSRSGQVDQHLFNKHGTKGRPVEKKRIAAPVGRGSVHPCLNRLAPRHTCLCPPG